MGNQLVEEVATSTTQQTQQTNIHALSRIRTCNPNNKAVSDLDLTPNGHLDRPIVTLVYLISENE